MNDVLDKIFSIVIPEHWKEENIKNPSSACRHIAYGLCCEIMEKYDIIPEIILCTKENGIYIKYVNEHLGLIIEVYNDNLDVVFLINNNLTKQIVYNNYGIPKLLETFKNFIER